MSYTLTTVGFPVYLHYCGGELERVNYLVKGTGCCGETDDESSESNDCCKDEGLYVQNTNHFTLKTINYSIQQSLTLLFIHPIQPCSPEPCNNFGNLVKETKEPPPKLLANLLVTTSVLRI
ncbi:MAG: hypothetical protein IT236_08740 [Bacteroidia bacterium]|nr:hypothetical protein [Bacteroidia bacterium]